MVLRLPQKLNDRLKGGSLATLPLHENPLIDWSIRTFAVDRSEYVLLSNTPSHYCVVPSGINVTDMTQFTERIVDAIRAVLEGVGCGAVAHGVESVRFAKYLDRSGTGSMNELAAHATAFLADGDLSVQEVGGRLNEVLLSALGRGTQKYGRPRDEFAALVARAGG